MPNTLSFKAAIRDTEVQGNILNFGAVPDVTDSKSEYMNSYAFTKALEAASNGDFGEDRRVLVPADTVFSFMPTITTEGLEDVVIQIDGTILLSKNFKDYQTYEYDDVFIQHKDAKNLTHRGDGVIDG